MTTISMNRPDAMNIERESIAQEFADQHKSFDTESSLISIYWMLRDGGYSDVTVADGCCQVEIRAFESVTGNPIVFAWTDIDPD